MMNRLEIAQAHYDLAIKLLQEEIADLRKSNQTLSAQASSEYISQSAAARRIGVHPATMARLLKKGRLQWKKIGSRVFISTSSLNIFMSQSNKKVLV